MSVQYSTVQYSTVLYSTVQSVQYSTVQSVQYSTVQYSTQSEWRCVQYSTEEDSAPVSAVLEAAQVMENQFVNTQTRCSENYCSVVPSPAQWAILSRHEQPHTFTPSPPGSSQEMEIM